MTTENYNKRLEQKMFLLEKEIQDLAKAPKKLFQDIMISAAIDEIKRLMSKKRVK